MQNNIKDDKSDPEDANYMISKLFEEYQSLIEDGRKIVSLSKKRVEEINAEKEKMLQYEEETRQLWQKGEMITFNVLGKRYTIAALVILKYANTLFFELIASKEIDHSKEIFIDRPTKPFGLILDFYRDGSLPLWKLPHSDLEELLVESEYFEVKELNEYIKQCLIDSSSE